MAKDGFFGEGNAQLPNSLMLMIDEIDNVSNEGGSLVKVNYLLIYKFVQTIGFFLVILKVIL
jgi:3-hydroxymyristoyl/3-hydroxydecanoyl-(acyl carrier protein) dehydratase